MARIWSAICILLSVLFANAEFEEHCDTHVLLQKEISVGATGKIEKSDTGTSPDTIDTSATTAMATNANPSRNLAVFYDGSNNNLNKTCKKNWPANAICETSIAALYREAIKIPAELQLSHYEPGVGTAEGDSYQVGVGTRHHAIKGYKWLAENYQSGDKVFVFGFSRGSIQARMLQGILKRVGLAKSPSWTEAVQVHNQHDDAAATAFKSSDKVWPDVKIHFMGLFEAVLRTLIHPYEHSNIERFYLKMTDHVEHLAHAIGTDEYRELMQANELYVDSSTQADQVWFMGVHKDVGGGFADKGVANIPLGWMAQKAEDRGMRLPLGWKSLWPVNFKDDVHTEMGMSVFGDDITNGVGALEVRNPFRCQSELGKTGIKPKFHQSIKDRMVEVGGWVTLQHCCPHIQEAMAHTGIEWVSDPHYDAAKNNTAILGKGVWVKVILGALNGALVPEWHGNPEYFVKVQGWHTDGHQLVQGTAAPDGCCTPRESPEKDGTKTKSGGSYWNPTYTGAANFGGAVILLPLEEAMSNEIIVEVFESDLLSSDFVGRTLLSFTDADSESMQPRDIDTGGTIDVQLEFLTDDLSAQSLLQEGPPPMAPGPAQCLWLYRHSGLSQARLCGLEQTLPDKMLELAGFSNADTCEEFIQDITTGS